MVFVVFILDLDVIFLKTIAHQSNTCYLNNLLEVMELVDTLRHPEKYAILGARAPTGLLLEGPPGTG